LTELITKPFGPQVIPEVVAQVLISLCPLIQKTVEPKGLMLVTEEYLDKLSEFVEVFLTQHLKRLEQAQYESMLPTFLELVLELTTKQPHVDGFLNCLNVWEVFVSYVEEAEQSESYDDRVRQVLSAYEQGLVGVMLHLVDRIRYATNRDQLEELNDEEKENASNNGNEQNTTGSMMNDLLMDEISILATGTLQDLAAHATATSNGTVSNAATAGGGAGIELSELKQFQVDCIALIRRIAAFPSCAPPLLERILPLVKENCENFFFHLHERPAFLPQSDPWQKEVYAVRDLTTECAILSSVAAQFYTNSTMNTKEQERIVAAAEGGWQVLHLFVTLGDYIVQNRLHTRGEVFVSIQCESITCIRYCLSCIPFLLGVESSIKQQVFNAIETIVTILLKTLDTTIIPSPQIVMHNSMQLLASLGFVLNYNDLIAIPSMALLEKNIHLFSQHLPLTIQAELYTSMSNSILNAAISFRKTTSDDSQQQQLVAVVSMARWSEAYGALILPIGEAIVQTALTIQQNPHRLLEQVLLTQLQRDCMITRFLARSIETKPKIAKDAFMTAYGPILPSLMTLFKSYLQSIKTIGERFSPSSSTSSTSSSSSSSTCTTGMKTQFKHAFKIIHEIIRLYGQLLQSIRKEMKKEQVTEIMETFINLFADIQFTSM
jgi:hypothetical protein